MDEYHLGSRLTISYWKDQIVDNMKGCKLVIEIKNQDQNDALVVSHLPELGDKEANLANQAIKSDILSIEKLLICTTHERAKKILLQFCEKFENTKYGKSFGYEICGLPPVLQISYLKPCMDSEKLVLSVDVLTGLIMVHISQFENCPFVDEIQQSIKKDDLGNFENLINDLRIWVTKERFKKTAEYFFTNVKEQLPFSSREENSIIRNMKDQKLFFQFIKNPDYYLLVVFADRNNSLAPEYYLLNVEASNIEYENKFKIDLDDINKSFLTVKSLVKLNKNCVMKSTSKERVNEIRQQFGLKRKFDELDTDLDNESSNESNSQNLRICSFFISDLICLLNFCEEKMVYSFLSAELQKRNFCHHLRFSSNDCNQYIDILQMPRIDTINLNCRLYQSLLSCSINLQGKFNSKCWIVTYKFSNHEIPESLTKTNAVKSMVPIMLDLQNISQKLQINRLIDEITNDWIQFSKVYDVLLDFTKLPNFNSYLDKFEINFFNYKKLVLNYGPNLNYTVTITWKNYENRYALNFGVINSTLITNNPHVVVSVQLTNEFNQHKSISTLIKILNGTVNSLNTIHKITCIPILGLIHSVSRDFSS